MYIVTIKRGIRRVGLNYGLPMWFVECGFGPTYKPEEAIQELGKVGAARGDWVCVLNGMKERGVGAFAEGLRAMSLRSEFEASSGDMTPGWYTTVSSWIVWWLPNGVFNYGAMRPRVDILIYKGNEIEKFLQEATKFPVDKGIVSKDEVVIRGVRTYVS